MSFTFGSHALGVPYFGGAIEPSATGDVKARCTIAGHSTFNCTIHDRTFFGGAGGRFGDHVRFFKDDEKKEPLVIITDRAARVTISGGSSFRVKARAVAKARLFAPAGSSALVGAWGRASAKLVLRPDGLRAGLSASAWGEAKGHVYKVTRITARCVIGSSSRSRLRARRVEQPPENILELLLR